MGWQEAWSTLEPPWRRALELAWEAFGEGSIAVGAVVVGAVGEVVATGRNRAAGTDLVPGQVSGSAIAHAEVNALALVARGTPGTTLVSTLEPCFLCTAAARYAQVDVVRYACADPVWNGVDRMGELNAAYARHPHAREEVDLGPLSTWSGGLALLSVVQWIATRTGRPPEEEMATGHVASDIRAAQPEVWAFAGRLLADGLRPDPGLALPDALDRWWPLLDQG